MLLFDLAKPLLFCMEPEKAHDFTLKTLKKLDECGLVPPHKIKNHGHTVMGIRFPNRVGLAAGMDKTGNYISCLQRLGFGFIEVGTITPSPQPGNPRPRIFRYPKRAAIINRMGFNSEGISKFRSVQQSNPPFRGILGVSIGQNLNPQTHLAATDYMICLRRVFPYASYIVANISSPNTPGLRNLEIPENLDPFLEQLTNTHTWTEAYHNRKVPLLLKVSPDLSTENLKRLADLLIKHKLSGVVATNTTKQRPYMQDCHPEQAGGLSGAPLKDLSLSTVSRLYDQLQGEIPIIGCGGIMSVQDAKHMSNAGAELVQLYTGFVYKGPELIREIAENLDE